MLIVGNIHGAAFFSNDLPNNQHRIPGFRKKRLMTYDGQKSKVLRDVDRGSYVPRSETILQSLGTGQV